MNRPVRLTTDPVGTPHRVARCCWCGASLVIAEIAELENLAAQSGKRCWVCPGCVDRQLAQALVVIQGKKKRLYHVPLPSQVLFYESTVRYRLWGGKAMPGKSTGVRWWLYKRSLQIPGHEALLLRENWDQLRDNHTLKMELEVPLLGGRWMKEDRMAVFGAGSTQSIIHCGHMADVAALGRYIGIEYGAVVADEAALYPLTPQGAPVLAELSTRSRREYTDREGVLHGPVFLPVTNPGGPSAAWLADMHIHHTPDFEMFPNLRPGYDDDGAQVSGYRAEDWTYLPAQLENNPYAPEDYKTTTLANLSEVRYKQLAEGDWTSFEGMFFPEWHPAVHVVEARVC